jgi:ATP-binding cassette subfamily F protein 3
MLRFTNITKRFGPKTLLKDISFAIHSREKIGLIGRNGYGKSTLLRLITGEDEPNMGEVHIPKGYKVGTLGQFLDFTAKTVRDEAMILKSPLSKDRPEEFPIEDSIQPWQAEKMLFGLGFSSDQLYQSPNQLSGGFQIRLQLAKLLLSDPDLLILDEPTNYLDIISIRWLEHFLQSWRKELLVVSHDQHFLEAVTTHTIAIHRQSIQKHNGSPSDLYRLINMQESSHEKTRLNAEKKAKKTEKFIREFRAGARSAGLVQSRIKMLAKQTQLKKIPPLPKIEFNFTGLPFQGDALGKMNNLSFGYEGQNTLFSNLSFTLEMGDKVAIIGPNGQGKSTLLNVLFECSQKNTPLKTLPLEQDERPKAESIKNKTVFKPKTGNIKYHNRTEVGYFSQLHKTSLEAEKTIFETLRSANSLVSDEEICKVCGNLLFRNDDRDKKISILSGGEKSRVNIGKILLEPHHVLLLDEPTNHFDLESVQALSKALKDFAGAIVFVSHDESLIHEVADKLIVFDEGDAFLYERTYAEFLREKGWSHEAEIKTSGKKQTSEQKVDYKAQKELQKILRPHLRALKKIENKIISIEDDIAGLTAQIKAQETKGNVFKADTLLQEKLKKETDLLPLYVELDVVEQKIEDVKNC